jgi:hypothetical protein
MLPPVPPGTAPPSAETAPVDAAPSSSAPETTGSAETSQNATSPSGVLWATEIRAAFLYAWISRFRIYPATRWDAALPSGPSAVPARTQAGAQRLAARAVCRPHWPLPPLSTARTVSRIRFHQEAAPGERRLLAAHLSSSRRCCAGLQGGPRVSSCRTGISLPSCSGSAGALGRLASLSDPTGLRPAPAHAGRADLRSGHGNARSHEASFPAARNPCRACSLAPLLGATAHPQCSPPPPPHQWKLFFMGFLPRSFRRSTSLSDPPLDPPVFLFCLFFPRPFLFAHSLASLLLSFSPLASSVRCPLGQTHEREEGMW